VGLLIGVDDPASVGMSEMGCPFAGQPMASRMSKKSTGQSLRKVDFGMDGSDARAVFTRFFLNYFAAIFWIRASGVRS
jgi:hypothetical protein